MIIRPQRLLGEGLLASASKHPSKTALVFRDKEYSYAQLKNSVVSLASSLHDMGLEKGDRVAIFINNSFPCTVAIYAASLAGGVFIVINPQTKADKLKYILKDSGANILITEARLQNEFIPAVKEVISVERTIISFEGSEKIQDTSIQFVTFDEFVSSSHETTRIGNNTIPVDLASIIYTSGSTGFPKGVMMTHQAMVFTTWSLIEYLRLSEHDRIMLVLPLAFDYGLYQLLMAITVGATLIVEQSFTFPATTFKQIEINKPTVFPGVPTIFAMIIASHKKMAVSFESITKITNTAASLTAEYIPYLKEIFPNALIFKMYGLTECKRVSYLEPELIDSKTSSVGKAIPGTEVLLRTPDGKKVNSGEPGILYVRGPHVMSGYWNKDELSNEMLKPGFYPWEQMLCTNDWFKMDEEGFLYFLGRNDDIIKTRGEKVSPVEVENVLYKIKGINEVVVVGIPDEIMGEVIVAFVSLHKNADLNEKILMHTCISNLENFMVPQKIVLIEEMPRSANGKIDKKKLKEIT